MSMAKAALPSFGVPVPGAPDRADYSVTEKRCATSLGRGNAIGVIDPHADVGKRPPPWDEYWTFGWLLLVLLLYLIPAVILAVVFKVDYRSGGGLVWIIVLYAVQIGAVTLLARLADWPAKQYLSLVRPNGRDTVIAIVSVALFIPAWHALAFVLRYIRPRPTIYIAARKRSASCPYTGSSRWSSLRWPKKSCSVAFYSAV